MLKKFFSVFIVLLTIFMAFSVGYADEFVEEDMQSAAENVVEIPVESFPEESVELIETSDAEETIETDTEVVSSAGENDAHSEASDLEIPEEMAQTQEMQSNDLQLEPIETPEIDTIVLNDQLFFEQISAKNLIKFKSLKAVVVNQQYDEQDLSAYNYFISSLSPSDSEIEYINRMISKGYSINVLVQIYEYWKDTAEDLSIIEVVYTNVPDDYHTNRYWIDDAFLNLSKQGKTKVIYSDLSVEDVREYVESGYTYDDLIIAERLSRKGVLAIEKILEERGNGKIWNDILKTVYNVDFNQATSEQINNMNLSVQTLRIVDVSRTESAQITLSADNLSTIDNLYIEKIFAGYNEYVVNAKIIRELSF